MIFDLPTIWFFLILFLFTGYIVLDGFDFGVGAIHLFVAKSDIDRRTLLNSIGPLWDGNEVWLVSAGGALFAAFPGAYATFLSGFYMPVMLFLFALIFRAVSIEFRSKQEPKLWRAVWDTGFSAGSVLASLVIGIALGNVLAGIPLDNEHEFIGSFIGILNPFALLTGIATLLLFATHGSIFAIIRTEGDLNIRIRKTAKYIFCFFSAIYIATSVITIFYIPKVVDSFNEHPWLFIVLALNILALFSVGLHLFRGRFLKSFLSSCLFIISLAALFAFVSYPNMLFSSLDAANSLTIYNAASSPKTHRIMLVITGIGMPLVLIYMFTVYRTFMGKVKVTPEGY